MVGTPVALPWGVATAGRRVGKLLMASIRHMRSDDEVRSTFRVMHQLRPFLVESAYVEAVRVQREQYGYHLVALVADGEVVCVAGYKFSHSFHFAKYMYVDDLVSDANARGKGHGEAMFDWLEAECRRTGCSHLRLDTGVQRHGAQRFYKRKRMDALCYHFVKEVAAQSEQAAG